MLPNTELSCGMNPPKGYHSSDEEHDWENQHGFIKGKSFLINMIIF